MKIAMTADPELPVPPKHYGGIERVIDMLVRGLVQRGHEVTLFANPGSTTPCRLIPYQGLKSNSLFDTLRNMSLITRHVLKEKYDLIHSHGRLAYLLPLLPMKIPKIMSYHRDISPRSVILGNFLSRGSLHFTAVSHHLMASVKRWGKWTVTHNGVPTALFAFNPAVLDDAPLIFLGRIEHVKGTHLAIEVAKKSGRRLIIAGNIEPAHQSYYDQKVRPHIDGAQVTCVGPVDDVKKNELLGKSAALLMPILWDEPFGIVMAEAFACGTPVIALKHGAVPEVVTHGYDGFVCDDIEQIMQAIEKIGTIERANCRRSAEEKFSGRVMVDAYERLYRSLRNP